MTPEDKKAWIICLSAGLFFFYEFFQLNIFDVINQSLCLSFHLNSSQISWMSSAFLWANVAFLIPAGLIIDRYSIRWVVIITMSICILGTLGFALAHSFYIAFFCHFIVGIGNAFCFLSCVVLVSHWFSPKRQALVIGIIVTMAFMGGMMAHTPFAYLNQWYGWRPALLADTGLGLALLIWISLKVFDSPTNLPLKRQKTTFKTVLYNSQNWLAGFYTSCLNLPIMILCALWGSSYLESVHHVSSINATKIISCIFIGSMIGCPLAGWLSDNQRKRRPMMVLGALSTLMISALLIMNTSLITWQLAVLFFGLGLFTSTQVISYPLIAESNLPRNTGTANALASVLIMGGAGLGQIGFGYLMRSHPNHFYTVQDFQYAMWIFPVTALTALIAVILLRETHCKQTCQ